VPLGLMDYLSSLDVGVWGVGRGVRGGIWCLGLGLGLGLGFQEERETMGRGGVGVVCSLAGFAAPEQRGQEGSRLLVHARPQLASAASAVLQRHHL
jgi:hypothetical protein